MVAILKKINTKKADSLQLNKTRFIKTIIATGLFTICGFASAYIFHLNEESLTINALFPGLLFISTTIIIFVLIGIQLSLKKLLIYYLTMYLTYLAVFFLTFFSTTFGFITGLFTTAIGAYTTFGLTNKLIRRIEFSPEYVFLLGGLSFLINDLLFIPTISAAIEPLYANTGDINTAFAGPFLFWQVIVGTKLSTTLLKTEP